MKSLIDAGGSMTTGPEDVLVSPDEPVEASPLPDSGRKRRFTIRSMMLIVLAVAIMFGYGLHHQRSWRRNRELTRQFMAWTSQLQRLYPSLSLVSLSLYCPVDLRGSNVQCRGHYTTPTGRQISLDMEARSNLFEDRGQLIISAEGRSVTWPVGDMERGRSIDLKAEFPEAFR